MKPHQAEFQREPGVQRLLVCAFPYAALKAFIPAGFIPSDMHFSTGYE